MSRLKSIRLEKNFTQQEIAEYCKISIAAVQSYEQNKTKIENCHLETLLKMSEMLDVRFFDLLEDESIRKKIQKQIRAELVQQPGPGPAA